MKPSAFTYHRPRSLSETLDVLAALGDEAKVLAGGQSLVPLMSMRLAAPAHLVDVNHLTGLDEIEVDADVVRIGALARHRQVEQHPAAYDALPLLRQALRQVAHPTIRNRGTTVGSLVHADPAAEMPAVLCLLDGSVRVSSVDGSRDVAAADFFLGPMESAVRPGELAVSATFRCPPAGSGTAFVEVSRRQGDYAMCGAGAIVTGPDRSNGDGSGHGNGLAARVALVSVGPGPVLVELPDPDDAGQVRDLVDAAIEPEEDIHASADYRRHLAHVLVARALSDAQKRVA